MLFVLDIMRFILFVFDFRYNDFKVIGFLGVYKAGGERYLFNIMLINNKDENFINIHVFYCYNFKINLKSGG